MTTGISKWRVTYQRPIEYELINAPNLFHPQNEALLSVGRVENARRFIGKEVEVSVTSVLQTTAGRMIFSEIKNGSSASLRKV